jgi:Domain of unknown function (DUF4115)
MTIVVIAALTGTWVIVLWRDHRTPPDPVASVDHQRRALEAMQAAAMTAKRLRGSAPPPREVATPRRAGSFSRRGPLVGLAVVTFVFAGVGLALLPRGSGSSAPPAAAPRPPTSTVKQASTRPATAVKPSRTPASTIPPVPAVVAIPGDAGTEQFQVSTAGFALTIAADGDCWVQVRPSEGVSPTFEGMIPVGTTQSFPADTSLWVRLGAPGAVRVSIDGQALALPSDGNLPVDLVFDVSGAAGATGTATSGA